MHQEAGGRNADLPRIAELGGTSGFGGQFHIGVLRNDDGGVTPQLHGGALHVLARHCGQQLADWGGAGERDFANDRMGRQIA